jgi:hypothetical protein
MPCSKSIGGPEPSRRVASGAGSEEGVPVAVIDVTFGRRDPESAL